MDSDINQIREDDVIPHLSVAFIGNVGSGKSTLLGNLLYQSGKVNEEVLKKIAQTSKNIKGCELDYRLICDTIKSEITKGGSQDWKKFALNRDSRLITLYDTPGNKIYFGNAITAIGMADAVVFVLSMNKGEYEASVFKRGHGQQLLVAAYGLGIKQVIIALTKTDPEFDEKTYNDAKDYMTAFCRKIGFEDSLVHFVPVSGLKGENVTKPTEVMKWYKGHTLYTALNEALKVPKRDITKGFRFPIARAYSVPGVGICVTGVVKYGTVSLDPEKMKKLKVVISPNNKTVEIKSVLKFQKNCKDLIPGDDVGFCLSGVSKKDFKPHGQILGIQGDKPPVMKGIQSFRAKLIVINHPTAIVDGYRPMINVGQVQISCNLTVLEKINKETGEILEKGTGIKLYNGDTAIVNLIPNQTIAVESYADYPNLGRIVVNDNNEVIALGIVLSAAPIY